MSEALKVAVSQRVDVFPDIGEQRDSLDQRLMTFLLMSGLLPVPVPNALCIQTSNGLILRDNFDVWMAALNPQALVLSGGNDIGECPERDHIEKWSLDYAKMHCLPTLGICRGMQMMAVWSGGSLVPVDGHVRTRHHLLTSENCAQWPNEVNSFHTFALKDCPQGFAVTARSDLGTIEAIRHENLPWEGWMWHPEREDSFSLADVNRLKLLFNICSVVKSSH